jgi:hypothetical protein
MTDQEAAADKQSATIGAAPAPGSDPEEGAPAAERTAETYPKLASPPPDDQCQQLQPANAVRHTTQDGHETSSSATVADADAASRAKRSAKQQKKWNRRLRIFFCCVGPKKNKDSIADVASIFAEFYSDLNVPSRDIAAGFVLLSKYQAAQRQWILDNPGQHDYAISQYLSCIPITEDTKFLDISSAEDSHLMNDLIYYMNYSLAIFGWPLQVIDDPCMLCCIYPYLRLAPSVGSNKKQKACDRESAKRQQQDKKAAKKANEKTKSRQSKKGRADDEPNDQQQQQKQPQQVHQHEPDTDRNSLDLNNNSSSSEQRDGNKFNGHKSTPETLDQIQRDLSRSVPGRLNDDCDMPVILEDNCCGCNSASAERRLAQHNYEIIYISYKSNINVVPFLVAADHSKQTIVVAIRGSMSLSDMVTDMNGTVDKLPIDNCPDDWLCHRGITRAAMYVKQTLLSERILERAFNCRPDLGSQNYGLMLCGHSLGAGTAGILGVLMRPLYPSLRAYLYSPPGGVLSLPVVEYTKEFAVGIILGNDTVPRLGVAQLERLRYHTLLSLKSSKKSPSKILARALCPSMCVGGNQVDYDPEQSLDLLHGTDARSFDYNNTKIPFQVQPQVLYVPGRLVHLVKNYSVRSRTQRIWREPIYQAVWTDNTIYDRIMISEGMFLDHLPNKLMHAMKMMFSRTLPGRVEPVRTTSPATVKVAQNESSPTRTETQISPKTTTKNQLTTNDRVIGFNVDVQYSDELDKQTDSDHNNNEQSLARAKNVIGDDNNNNSEDVNNNNNNNEIVLNVGSL